jgi:hypothetical protein
LFGVDFAWKMAPMSAAKFLGLCIVFAALIISGTIVWSTTVTQAALAGQAPKDVPVPAASSPVVATVRIDGPVTLAPFTAPIPVTLTNSDDNPVVVKQKDAPEKTWHRYP